MTSVAARVLSLFGEYMDLSPAQRTRLLERLERSDPETHAALAAMIAADAAQHPLDEPLEFLFPALRGPSPVPAATACDGLIGARLGAWRIARKIAEGGMGAVYEAYRSDGHYQQRVALKCIRIELASPALIDAFLAERNHLATLQHPNIAALLDGGVDADGHPWFAMHYVEGTPIDHWCDERRLSLNERVALLLQVCDALVYAHAQGILHQDIKPSNLLVNAQGRLQLLDFGLSASLTTQQGEKRAPIAFSPGFSAPEIALKGEASGATADIYSLGAVLCLLLCGAVPTPSLLAQAAQYARGDDGQCLRRLVLTVASAGTAEKRSLPSLTMLSRQLEGDLEAIVGRCLATAPDQRYGSVAELRDDLRRWLERRPVEARAGGPLYRGLRFLRRHRLSSSLAALTLGIFALGAGTAIWQSRQAVREMEAAQAVSRLFEETLGTATLSGLSETPLSSTQLLQRTETKVRSLELQDQPRVLAYALSTLARSYATIGDYSQATALAEEAASGETSAETQATLASLLNIQARSVDAERVARAALATLGDSSEERPVRLQLLTEIARSQWGLAQRDQATRTLDGAFALAKKQQAEDPTPYIELLIIRGHWQRQMLHWLASESDLRLAIELAKAQHPLLADDARQSLSLTLRLLDRNQEAQQIAAQSLESRRANLGEQHPKTGEAWLQLAGSQRNAGRSEEFTESVARGTAIVRSTYGERHPNYAYALMLSSSVPASAQASSYSEAVKNLRRAQNILLGAYGPEHSELLLYQGYLGSLLMTPPAGLPGEERKQLRQEGLTLLERAVADANRLKIPIPHVKMTLAEVLISLNRQGDLAFAQRLLDECQAEAAGLPSEHPMLGRAAYIQATILYASGAMAEADARLEPLMRRAKQGLPAFNARLLLFRVLPLRAAIAAKEARPQQARRFLTEMRDISAQLLGPEHATTLEATQRLETFDRTGQIALASR